MYIDIVISIFLILGFYFGFSKGIIKPVVTLSSIVVAIFVSNTLMPLGKAFITQWFEINTSLVPFISFILLFIISILLIRGLGTLLESFIKLIYLNFINRCIGGIAFFSIFLLIISIMISGGNYLDLFTLQLREESALFEYVEMVFPWIYDQYPVIKEYFMVHL